MRGLVVALAEVEHVKRQRRKADAVAQLFNEQAATDDKQIVWQRIAHIHINNVGQRDGTHHGPQPSLETVATCEHATQDASQGKPDDAHRAAGQSELLRRQPQTACRMRAHEEGNAHR